MKILKISVFLILGIALHSCSSSDTYPDEWGYVMDNSKLGDSIISGIYNNKGECSRKDTSKIPISDLIQLPGLSYESCDCDNIIINLLTEEKLSIILRQNTDTIYKTIFPDNGIEFKYTDDGIELKVREGRKSGDLIFPIASFGESLTLMKNKSGSLIARYFASNVIFYFMVPVYSSYSTWLKFNQYK